MQYTDITAYAVEQANVSATDYTDSKLLKYVNRRYHDLENRIKKYVAQDYFFDIYTVDTVANQNEYTFETSSATQVGMLDVIRLEIKRATTDTYYTLVKPQALDDRTTDELATWVSKDSACYEIKDSSIFIYPTPTVAVTNGLKMQCTVNLIDLTATDDETLIFPRHSELRQYHYIIALWVIADIFGMKRLMNEKAAAEADYERALQQMITQLGNRESTPIEGILPSGSSFKLWI